MCTSEISNFIFSHHNEHSVEISMSLKCIWMQACCRFEQERKQAWILKKRISNCYYLALFTYRIEVTKFQTVRELKLSTHSSTRLPMWYCLTETVMTMCRTTILAESRRKAQCSQHGRKSGGWRWLLPRLLRGGGGLQRQRAARRGGGHASWWQLIREGKKYFLCTF